jgi:hypothetical protein
MRFDVGPSLLVLALIVLTGASPATAGQCVQYPTVQEEFEAAFLVFEGRVLRLEEIPGRECCHQVNGKVTFQVKRSWKGHTDGVLRPTIGVTDGIFQQGRDYIVFASGPPAVATGCSRSAPVGEAASTIAWLNGRIRQRNEVIVSTEALLRTLLLWHDLPEDGELSGLSDPARTALAAYRARTDGFTPASQVRGRPLSPEHSVSMKYRALETVLAGLFDDPAARTAATDFVPRARLSYEWEGSADGPLAEASAADQFLAAQPEAPITPYLNLFAGHRTLCAAASNDLDPTTERPVALLQKAIAHLKQAAAAGHPLITVVSEHLRRTRQCFGDG